MVGSAEGASAMQSTPTAANPALCRRSARPRLLPLAEVTERDRVPQRVDLRDAVFPFGARGAGQQVGGARRGGEGGPLPLPVGPLAAEAEAAGGEKRKPDDLGEHRLVAMPADRGAGGVLGDQHVLERLGRQAGKG